MTPATSGLVKLNFTDHDGYRRATVTMVDLDHRNALGHSLITGLESALDDAMQWEPHTVCFRGNGRAFSAGLRLDEALSDSPEQFEARFRRIETLLQRVVQLPCLTAAHAERWAVGAGADLLTACDVRTATPGTRLKFPGWQFGVALGTRRLTARIGHAALDVLATGRTLATEEALQLGLLTAVTQDREAMAETDRIGSSLAALPVDAARRLLRLTRSAASSSDMEELLASVRSGGVQELARYADRIGFTPPDPMSST